MTLDSGIYIRGGSQDLCNFSFDLRMPAPIYYTGMVCYTRFQVHVFDSRQLATNRVAANFRVRDQQRCGKRSSGL